MTTEGMLPGAPTAPRPAPSLHLLCPGILGRLEDSAHVELLLLGPQDLLPRGGAASCIEGLALLVTVAVGVRVQVVQ